MPLENMLKNATCNICGEKGKFIISNLNPELDKITQLREDIIAKAAETPGTLEKMRADRNKRAKENFRHYTLFCKYAFAIFLILSITLLLFRGSFDQGMQFDEVFRLNNLLPLINSNAEPYDQSIFSIKIFGYSIPLMYKFYVSSAVLIKWLPLMIFNDYLFGIRFLYITYFFISITTFFLILSRYNYYYALITSALVATSPIFFPEVRIGFASSIHIFFLTLSLFLFYNFFNEKKRTIYLFLAIFILFFAANVEFYFIWVIASIILSSIFLFPDYWRIILTSYKYMVVAILGAFLGLFNFIVYNLLTGFSTFKPLFLKIFFPSEYNLNPIDYKLTPPLFEEVLLKLDSVSSFFDGYGMLYLLVLAMISLLYLFITWKIIRMNKFHKYRTYILSFVCFLLIFFFILITPNTTRAGHYVYLVPFIELSVLSLIVLLSKIYNQKRIQIVAAFFLVILLTLNIFVSNSEIARVNITKGTGHFSPAIFDLNHYLNENDIESDDIVFLEWCMHSQLYFLNKGEFKINSLVFQLLGKNKEERYIAFKSFFLSPHIQNRSTSLYFPVYAKHMGLTTKGIYEDFSNFIISYRGRLERIHTFYETNGDEIIQLYELKNTRELINNIRTELENATRSQDLKIVDFGPKVKKLQNPENFGIWIKTINHSRSTKVTLNGSILKTVYYTDHLTALVPYTIVSQKGKFKIQLYDLDRNIVSEPVYLEIK